MANKHTCTCLQKAADVILALHEAKLPKYKLSLQLIIIQSKIRLMAQQGQYDIDKMKALKYEQKRITSILIDDIAKEVEAINSTPPA